MRILAFGTAAPLAFCVVASAMAAPYCPNPAHRRPQKTPSTLTASVARAFHIDPALASKQTYVRCADGRLMACSVGANLDCFKANARRKLPGATAWCRQYPGSRIIPMSATGHDTIYEWTCSGRQPVVGHQIVTVDRGGYIAQNWRQIR